MADSGTHTHTHTIHHARRTHAHTQTPTLHTQTHTLWDRESRSWRFYSDKLVFLALWVVLTVVLAVMQALNTFSEENFTRVCMGSCAL